MFFEILLFVDRVITVDICLEYRSWHESSVAIVSDNEDEDFCLVKNRWNHKIEMKRRMIRIYLQNMRIDYVVV